MDIHTTVITDPFLSAHPECVSLAIESLEVICQNCWPSISARYTAELIRIIALAWQNFRREEMAKPHAYERLRAALMRIGRISVVMLSVAQQQAAHRILLSLHEEHSELHELFPVADATTC